MSKLNEAVIEKLVDAMTDFAANTANDRLSVHVARVAQRLQHVGRPFEKPLTKGEHAVIRPFAAKLELAIAA